MKTVLVVLGISLIGSALSAALGRAVGPDWGYTVCFSIGVLTSAITVSWIWSRP